MREWKRSESNTRPEEIDTTSSESTVYLRRYIEEEEREEGIFFVYEECQISKEEWIIEQTQQNTADTQYMAIMTGIDLEG